MDDHLVLKYRRLLARRNQLVSVRYFLWDQRRRHVIIAVCFCVLFGAACATGNDFVAVATASLWAGRFLRDIQWYRTSSREWESAEELLDWDKIERLAQ